MTKSVDNDILIPEMAALLSEGKDVRFTPTGISMRPFIEGGKDTVVLHKLPTVRIGDIALAAINYHGSADRQKLQITNNKSPQAYVLHRVIGRCGDNIILMGDGNLSGTEQCTTSDILGTVIRIENSRGHRKPLTRGRLWYRLRSHRRVLLKIYRKMLKW